MAISKSWFRFVSHPVMLVVLGSIAVLPVVRAVAYEPVAPWQLAKGTVFSSSAGRFDVAFPRPPRERILNDELAGEPVDVYQFQSLSTTSRYIVAYADLPDVFLSLGAETVLDELRDHLFADSGIDVVLASEVNAQLSNHPGRRYRYSDDDGTVDMRLYLVDGRIYLLVANDGDATNVDRFISSFVLR